MEHVLELRIVERIVLFVDILFEYNKENRRKFLNFYILIVEKLENHPG